MKMDSVAANTEMADLGIGVSAFLDIWKAPRAAAKSKRLRRRALMISLAIADFGTILSVTAALCFAYLPGRMALEQISMIAAIIMPLYFLAALNGGAFEIKSDEGRTVPIWKAATAFLYSSAGLLLLVFMAKASEDFSRVAVTGTVAISLLALVASRSIINRWARKWLGPQPFATLCIYDQVPFTEDHNFTRISAERYGLSADASKPDMIARLAELVHDFDQCVIHCRPEDRFSWAFVFKSLRVPAEIAMPEIHELDPLSITRRAGKTSLLIATGPLKWHQRAIKRGFDLAVASAAILALSPIMFLVAASIKLDSSGPILFRQKRIGLNNRPFEILKFRSMRTELLDPDGKVSTSRGDPRVTRVGAFIRRASLDELPQLINVLKGDMSIVGPRPHAHHSRAGELLFWEVDNAYWHRHVVKPGITGLAQIRGHRGNTFHEDHLRQRLSSDLEYVANWSLLGDIKIVMRTFRAVMHENAF